MSGISQGGKVGACSVVCADEVPGFGVKRPWGERSSRG